MYCTGVSNYFFFLMRVDAACIRVQFIVRKLRVCVYLNHGVLYSSPCLVTLPPQSLLFDFGSEVYLWHGKDVTPSERKVALQLAQQVWAGPYDYSNCRVNPLDPSATNTHIPR